MKTKMNIVGLFLLSAAVISMADEPSELLTLRKSYDNEIKRVTQPVNATYLKALQQLKDNFTRGSKLEQALSVDVEMKKFNSGTVSATIASSEATSKPSKREITKEIAGNWGWIGETPGLWITIRADGTAKMDNKPLAWKARPDGSVTLTNAQRATATVTFDSEFTSFSGTGFSGMPITGTRRQ